MQTSQEISETRIGLIYLYYGSWPWYFDYFLKSCEFNPEITFILVTDIVPPKDQPKNVTFIIKSLKDVERDVSSKIGFKVSLNEAYKLCDFKPAYGLIFEDILSDFEFWGHGDIDLVFGHIKSFITPEILLNYDTISVRHDYPSGFFMLYRNIPEVNKLFMRSADYKKIFTSDGHYCFDECNFQHGYLFGGMDIFATESKIESMMHVIKQAEFDNVIRPYFDFCVCEGLPGAIKWDNGTLSINNEFEILLYHFIQLKENIYFYKPKWKSVPNVFYVEKNAFFKYSKTSLLGYVARLWIGLKVDFRKTAKILFLRFNKLVHRFYSSNLVQQNQYLGIYICRNKNLEIKKDEDGIHMSLSYPKISKLRLHTVPFDSSLLVDYRLGFLLSRKKNILTMTALDGQKEVYQKKCQ